MPWKYPQYTYNSAGNCNPEAIVEMKCITNGRKSHRPQIYVKLVLSTVDDGLWPGRGHRNNNNQKKTETLMKKKKILN